MKLPENIFRKDLSGVLDKLEFVSKAIFYVGPTGDNTKYVPSTLRKIANEYNYTLQSISELVETSIDAEQIFYLLPELHGVSLRIEYPGAYRVFWKSLFPRKPLSRNGAFLIIKDGETLVGYSVPDSKTLEDSLIAFCAYLTRPKKHYSDGVQASRFGLIYDYEADENDEYADRNFFGEVHKLSEEIKEKVKKLRLYGMSEIAIKALFQKEQKLSRLVITDDYRIVLPDYGDMEIKMEPLPKAVYFLYLRHPEGLMFKELPCYRDEFMEIYKRLTNRRDAVALRSAERVLNPMDNSINEKCSRIREAFISRFDDTLASKYYITSYYQLKKRIELDRELVDLGPISII